MKKILSVLLAAVMVLGMLAGCSSNPGGEASKEPDPTKAPDPAQSEPANEPAGKPMEGQTVKVAALSSGYIDAYP